jgi:alkaline ceramidase
MEIPKEFKLLSSEVDWCEENYTVTPFIAEFWNTVRYLQNAKILHSFFFQSNAIFLIIPPILSIKYKNYGEVLKVPVGYVWSLLTIVGLGSIYFHSTLSLVGQLVDEIAILWVIMCAWALFLPTSMLRKKF